MMAKCLLVCLAFGVCSAQLDVDLGGMFKPGEIFKINKEVDHILPEISKLVTLEGYDSGVVLPDLGLEASPIFIGVTLDGLSHLTRSGDAVITLGSPNQLDLKARLRLNNSKAHVSLVPYMHSNMTWEIDSIDFDVSLSLVTPTKNLAHTCTTRYNYIRLVDLGKITQRSANKEFDNVPPFKEIVDLIIPRYNLAFKDQSILKSLGQDLDICKRD